MFKLDFIGVAAPRCGTSWIARCLSEHPQISLAQNKETHFFDEEYNFQKGLKFYQSFFEDQKGKIKGEFGPSYYLKPEAGARIKTLFPQVKILVCLRNPIERAFSHYLYEKNKGGQVASSFAQELEKKSRILKDGFYYHYLNKFLGFFPPENVLFLIYEEAKPNPDRFIKRIYGFLGVDINFDPPSLYETINASQGVNYRIPFIKKAVYRGRKRIKKSAAGRGLLAVLKVLGLNKIVKWVLRMNYQPRTALKKKEEEQIDTASREKLKTIYKSDIKSLERLIGRKLNFWC